MRLLPEMFEGTRSQKGWDFKLIDRNGNYAIYQKQSESNIYYKVIVIRVQKAKVAHYPGGRVVDYPETETYPKDEDFGLYGWSYGSLDAAHAKYNEISAVLQPS
jgi:hypothetical protein